MYKKLVIIAFEKAKKDIPGKSNKTSRSELISDILLEDFKRQISGRTLRNLYDDSIAKNDLQDITIKSIYVEYLCLYLGIVGYNDFLKKFPDESTSRKKKSKLDFVKENKIIFTSLFFILGSFLIANLNRQRWMVWEGNQYIEVNYDTEKYEFTSLKPFQKDYVENFSKITPDSTTIYFNSDGAAKLWYGKNNTGELEYFNKIGKHPETGKTLKEITKYMIDKHINNTKE